MPSITIRNLPVETHRALKVRAASVFDAHLRPAMAKVPGQVSRPTVLADAGPRKLPSRRSQVQILPPATDSLATSSEVAGFGEGA